ncbi:hypothetical protein Tco_0820669 [Tanacetum coccineum]|uniref:Uncharacterized protein n=1 Tax=Tanacetum coccineum TaxID=301880 RepID=A0ABQ5AA35_9ASTR
MSTEVHQAAETVTMSNELDLLFDPLFDEYFNGENQVVLKSSAVTTTNASNKRQQQPDSTSSTSTLATTVTANGNFDLSSIGVKSYQKKLNITKPETFRSDISNMTPYTTYNNPQGIIYLDKLKTNRLMRSDKLYKFCDGTLTYVRTVLHDIASSLRMDYLPKRRWSKLDRRRSCIMIKAIDQQLFERRLMRNLEKFVGGREYGEDFRLLERTI